MDVLYIVMPAYNESANIAATLDQWYPVIERVGGESRVVVFDDGSKDDTFQIMQRYAEDHPLFIPVHKENSGHGGTVLYAYKYALEHGADFVFQTDTDGQTNPDEFWDFWEKRNTYDMIIGHRSNRKDGLSRVVVTRTLRRVVKRKFKVDVLDPNTPFRLMSAATLSENVKLIPDGFNLSNVLLSVIYKKKGQRVLFLPITFKPRQGGTNSINIKSIVGIGRKALDDFAQLNSVLDEELRA